MNVLGALQTGDLEQEDDAVKIWIGLEIVVVLVFLRVELGHRLTPSERKAGRIALTHD